MNGAGEQVESRWSQCWAVFIACKGKVFCIPAVKTCRGSGTVALFILNLALEEVSGVLNAPSTLSLVKNIVTHRRLGGPQAVWAIWRREKSLGPTGI